jgi:hypothetical protein
MSKRKNRKSPSESTPIQSTVNGNIEWIIPGDVHLQLELGVLHLDISEYGNKKKEKEYNDFIRKYNNSKEELCVNPKTNKREQDLFSFQFCPRNYSELTKSYDKRSFIIIYLYHEDVIFAFALLEFKGKMVELLTLCSHINKNISSKKLGIFLLDYIYDEYVSEKKYLFKIQPENHGLLSYYKKWKTPSSIIDTHADTNGLLYRKYSK